MNRNTNTQQFQLTDCCFTCVNEANNDIRKGQENGKDDDAGAVDSFNSEGVMRTKLWDHCDENLVMVVRPGGAESTL